MFCHVLVAFLQLVFGLDAAAVDADLAAAQQAIDASFRHTGQHALQEIVDALTGRVGVDPQLANTP